MAEQVTMNQDGTAAVESDGVRRRDFINIAAVSFAGLGGASVLIPLITQMAPSKDVLAQASTEPEQLLLRPGRAASGHACVYAFRRARVRYQTEVGAIID